MAEINPYEGLSDQARELCIKRMVRTLGRKPRKKKTREYINSLTGKPETEAELRARAHAAARDVIARAERGEALPVILRARKQRLGPMARKDQRRHPTKHCRRAVRFQPHFMAEGPREMRDLQETNRLREALTRAQGGLCAICGHPMREKASLDHVIPHALGGQHGPGNYVAAHGECNGDKTNDVPTGCEMIWLLAVNARLGFQPVRF